MQGARIIAITSGKGGVGKTFVSANLAAAPHPPRAARAGPRCRPGPGQPGRGAQPASQDHTARRVHRQIQPGRSRHRSAWRFSVVLAGSGMVEYSRLTPGSAQPVSQRDPDAGSPFRRDPARHRAGISDVVLFSVSLASEVLIVATPSHFAHRRLCSHQGVGHAAAAPTYPTGGQPGGPAGDGRAITGQLQQVLNALSPPIRAALCA